MLQDLVVVNGKMSLTFDPLNTKYTVFIDDNSDMELELEYVLSDGAEIEILNNNLVSEYTKVEIIVRNDKDEDKYYLDVYKIEDEAVNKVIDVISSVDVLKKDEISPYAAPGIGVICFLIVLFLFVLLFGRKKKIKS